MRDRQVGHWERHFKYVLEEQGFVPAEELEEYIEEPALRVLDDLPDSVRSCWISNSGKVYPCGFAAHQVLLGLLDAVGLEDFDSERDAELAGWVKLSNGQYHIGHFPVTKAVKDFFLMRQALNGGKIWVHDQGFQDPESLVEFLESRD